MTRSLAAASRYALIALVAFASASVAQPRQQAAPAGPPVSVALVLAVDVSSSIDERRFQVQRRGYAEAFLHRQVIEAIRHTEHQRIAVAYFEWSGVASQRVIIPWTVIDNAETAGQVANALLVRPRPFDGMTSISAALEFAVRLIDAAPYPGARFVIDVSGDGENNDGRPAAEARDAAVARGITVNGLAINSGAPGLRGPLDEFYRDHVAGGDGAFVMVVDGFDSFAYGIVNKMVREVAGLSPATRLAALDRRGLRIAGVGGHFAPTVPPRLPQLAWRAR